jgi:hypothetical protein
VPTFAVTRAPGPAWDTARTLTEQDGWPEHAAFMNGLAEDGFVVVGGPAGTTGHVLLMVRAESATAARQRLAEDPWEPVRLLRTELVWPWRILLASGEAPEAEAP